MREKGAIYVDTQVDDPKIVHLHHNSSPGVVRDGNIRGINRHVLDVLVVPMVPMVSRKREQRILVHNDDVD